LAKGEILQQDLAKKYGVTGAAITKFKQRHAATIQTIRDNAADQFAGILLASQVSRMETYQQIVDDARERGDDKLASRVLRQMAEERGHLPGRVTLSGDVNTTTKYVIDGMDPEDLK
jgi:hypothetical protein